MADIRPFEAIRPAAELAARVAALPYDVYSREEAAEAVKGKEYSFLNIDRPETMFDKSHDMYADDVYEAAKNRYESQKKEGVYIRDEKPCYYIYELTMNGRRQTGIAALSSVDDYLNGICKKHENTVEAKERDRIHHVDSMSAQTGPIFLGYHTDAAIDKLVADWEAEHKPVYDFVSEDGIGHRVWVIDDAAKVEELKRLFSGLECTYIADGHHRAASAVKVALKRRKAAKAAGKEDENAEYNYFLSVLFPDNQLKIMDYNRVVKDLNGHSVSDFLDKLGEIYDIELTTLNCHASLETASIDELMRPTEKYEVGMYLDGRCYRLKLKRELIESVENDPVKSLDVSVLQEKVLSELLSIADPRTDSRIKFVGGIRGLYELVRDADAFTAETKKNGELEKKGSAVSFAMYPTSILELFSVADAGLLMPPKSTWFEPKLRSGLFIHEF